MIGKTFQYNPEPAFSHTDLHNIEDRISRLSPVIIYTYDVGLKKCNYLNNKLKEVLGYDNEEVAAGDFRNFVFTGDAEKVKQEMDRFYGLKDNETYCYYCRLQHKNNSQRYFKTTGSILRRDNKGNVSSLLFIAQDITENPDIEKTPEKKKVIDPRVRILELERTNKELLEFTTVAAQGLKDPFRKIYAYSERLRSRFSDSEMTDVKEYLDHIRLSAANMQSLINNLLEFSRVSHSAVQAYEFCSLNYLLEEVKTGMLLKLLETKTTIWYDRLPKAEVIPTQIKKLFYNLLTNAMKFQRQDAVPEIRIRYEILNDTEKEKLLLPADRVFYKIIVRDNGIGFNRNAVGKIFNPFTRLHNKQEYPGTGTGLFICKKIIENHQGLISADSEPGLGAIFTIILPEKQ